MNDFADLFLGVVNLSGSASIVILVVLLARLLLKKAPKIFSYALWAIVLVRLLIPISITSPVSAVPELSAVDSYEINAVLPEIEFETFSDWQENLQSIQNAPENNGVVVLVSRGLEPTYYLSMFWGAGMAVMGLYGILSYVRVRRKVRISVPLRDNIFIADDIKSPFVMGLFRPKIYLPCALGEKEQEYIILHEQHHIRRFDHLIKALAFLALTVHWFNPLVWLAFVLSARDMEMSCDEAVICKAGEDIRAEYSASLLTLATGRRIIVGMPLAFGEGDPKSRIRNLANWKKPAFWVIVIAIIVCIALAVCLLTDPVDDGTYVQYAHQYGTELDEAIRQAVLDHNYTDRYEGLCQTAGFKVLSCEEGIEEITVYGIALHQVYRLENGVLVEEGGSNCPAALTFKVMLSGEYVLTEYWEPRYGTYYPIDIKAKFRGKPYPDIQKYIVEQQLDTYAQAMDFYGVDTDVLINTLFEDIANRAQWYDRFGGLMEGCANQRAILAAYGTDTLEYCFSEFLRTTQEGIRGQAMAYVCNEIMESMGEQGLEGWSYQQSGQDWFDAFYSNALALRYQYPADELKEEYPGSWLYLTMTGILTDTPDWGVTLTAENVTPTGLTIVCTQSGGKPTGQLFTGSYYFLQINLGGMWKTVEHLDIENLAWTSEAWIITMSGETRWSVNWSWLYGELEPGQYRIGKQVSDFRAPGDCDDAILYAEFTIE